MGEKFRSELDRGWTKPETILATEPTRQLFQEATQVAVRSVLQAHIKPTDTVLEIGSGLGKLLELAPDYSSQVQQTEQSAGILAGHRRRHPDSNIRPANVYDLAFEDGTFDVVLGYATFDALENPQAAVAEMSRVLKPNGKIIHMLDLQASATPLFHDLELKVAGKRPEEMAIPFPKESADYIVGVQMIPLPDIRKGFAKLPKGAEKLVLMYVGQPDMGYAQVTGNYELSIAFAKMIYQVFATPKTEVIHFNPFFFKRMANALTNGFILQKFGSEEGTAIVDRDERYERYDPYENVLSTELGFPSGSHSEEVSQGKVQLISKVHTIVAQKAA